jgi:hypothetical protein
LIRWLLMRRWRQNPDARLASSPGRRCSVMLGSSPRWPVVAAMFRPAKLNE